MHPNKIAVLHYIHLVLHVHIYTIIYYELGWLGQRLALLQWLQLSCHSTVDHFVVRNEHKIHCCHCPIHCFVCFNFWIIFRFFFCVFFSFSKTIAQALPYDLSYPSFECCSLYLNNIFFLLFFPKKKVRFKNKHCVQCWFALSQAITQKHTCKQTEMKQWWRSRRIFDTCKYG